MNRKHRKRE